MRKICTPFLLCRNKQNIIFAACMLGVKSKTLLFPYWAVLAVRNFLFDRGIKKSVKFDIPVISVGNITVGGTGKTPHTEMLVRILKEGFKVGVVSRGYKRKTRGFRVVEADDDFRMCGDEPLQIKRKFPDVCVAVCKNRIKAIRRLVDDYGVNMIILDDAFQYRNITPLHNILLINYFNTIAGDNLLPIGSLRDLPSQIKRADIVIVSKSPDFGDYDGGENLEMAEQEVEKEEIKWRKELGLRTEQRIYFSTVSYLEAKPVFPQAADTRYIYSKFALLFSGIANDTDIRRQLVGSYRIVDSLKFKDHKNYSNFDIREIAAMGKRQPAAVIITTEKDSVRLLNKTSVPEEIKKRLFYLPIEVKIIPPSKIAEFKNVIF